MFRHERFHSGNKKFIKKIWKPASRKQHFPGNRARQHLWTSRTEWRRKIYDTQNIGSLIESPALYGNLTAKENLLVHTKLLGIPEVKIDEVLDTVHLQGTGKKRAAQFSMGMKQRLGLAAALLCEPELLILDEPANGLDPFGIQELRGLIASLPDKGITVLLSSHILSEVAQIADTIGIIDKGRLLFQGTPAPGKNLEQFFTDVILKGGQERCMD